MSTHPPITAAEAADRLAIRELFDAYAHCADRRDAKGQMALFTEDTRFVVYMDARNPEPTQDLRGREALAPVFDALNAYAATMHFNGLPERNLGPLPVQFTMEGPGTYLSAPVIVTITGQWSLRITIRSDAFDETTVTIPVSVH